MAFLVGKGQKKEGHQPKLDRPADQLLVGPPVHFPGKEPVTGKKILIDLPYGKKP